jgi:putative phage-type endonuclease
MRVDMVQTIDRSRADDWFKARKKGIGGSDAAVVLGISPWKTPIRLWREKRNEVAEDDLIEKQHVYWGLRLEPVVADEYTLRTGHECYELNKIVRSKRYPWMLCNVDRIVKGTPSRTILEIKTVGMFVYMNSEWGEEGTNQVPAYYYSQAQHNMVVCEAEFCDMPVLIGGNEYRCYTIPFDKSFCETLIERERLFWQAVETGIPPEPMNVEDLLLLWPFNAPGKTIEASPEAAIACTSYRQAKSLARSANAEADKQAMLVKQEMQDAEFLTFNGEIIATWRTTKKKGRMFRAKDTEMLS